MQRKQKNVEIRIKKEKKEQKIHVIGKGEEGTFTGVCSCSLNMSGLLSGTAVRTCAPDFPGNFSFQITALIVILWILNLGSGKWLSGGKYMKINALQIAWTLQTHLTLTFWSP